VHFFQLKMHRCFKKLSSESLSPSTFAYENSPLNQETDEHNCLFEDDLFESVSNDDIMCRFQDMKARQG